VYGVNEQKSRNSLTVRAGDEMFLRSYDFDATDVFAYQEVYEGLLDSAPEGDSVLISARKGSGVFPLMYFPQALGIILARLIGAGRVGLLFLGRFANLVFYSLTVMLAIKHMPFMKHALFIAALMPMCMQLAASFSYDAYVISLCFLFTALVFRLVFENGQMAFKVFIWPALTALLIAPAKAVYFPVLLLLFLIPAAKFPNKRFVAARLVVLVAAVFLWSAFNLETLKAAAGTLKTQQPSASFARSPENAGEPASVGNAALHLPGYTEGQAEFSSAKDPVYPVRDNNEAYQRFTLGYVLRHIPQTLMLTARTFWEQCPLWLQGLVGGRLGEIIAIEIEINWLFVLGLAVLLLASSLADNSDAYVLQKRERRFSLLISLLVFLLFFFGCVTWTPINYDTVFGVQGRYFIPVLPLALLAFRGDNLRFKRQASKGLCFAALALTALSALQAFTIIIQR
ncbi:MAG: DUF2142 domain-containing protein, partial [Oscillospiraceae bacterium]|nr:DUF2142 domain-containing protein [Oscillospiraceae bacterium]